MRQRTLLMMKLIILFFSYQVMAGVNRDPKPITKETFIQRRLVLLDSLESGVAVLYSQGRYTESGYRADTNFWYLTGVDEPGAILILNTQKTNHQILLLPPRNLNEERWNGERPDRTDSLRVILGFDQLYEIRALDSLVMSIIQTTKCLHLISKFRASSEKLPKDLQLYRKVLSKVPGGAIVNSSHFLKRMRMIKSPEEIAAIERAIEVTHQGLTEVLPAIKPGVAEFRLDGILENAFKQAGSQHMAFDPIIGSGKASTILHYQKRDRILESGQLVLFDIGAEWDRYDADISRTFPVDGRFSKEQAKIYDIVLAARLAAIASVKPGVTIQEINEKAMAVIREAGYEEAFMHGISHHLGLDCHDYADNDIPMKPGMVITIEPGIYLPDEEIGIRIEDNVLVTRDGCRILSDQIPREREEVERWMKGEK